MRTSDCFLRVLAVMATIGLAIVICCSTVVADNAPRGFIGDTGSGWDTSSKVTARASSTHYADLPSNLVGDKGLLSDGLTHTYDSYGGLRPIWLSDGTIPPSMNFPRGGTVPGGVWVEFTLDKAYPLGEMWIWNANEGNTYLGFAMKSCTIQYSLTGSHTNASEWTTIFRGSLPQTTIDGNGFSSLSKRVFFNGAMAKYVVITSALEPEQNHNGDYLGPTTSAYYTGLSKVRFYPGESKKFNLSGIAFVATGGADMGPIPISIDLANGDDVVASKTIKNGEHFAFEQILSGDYKLSFRAAGCLPKSVDIILDLNKDVGAVALITGQ